MSLPSFPSRSEIPTRDEVINQIISSIAMEELGLSHIINAEGEKLQYALGTIPGSTGPDEPLTMDDLLKLNDSVHRTLDSAMMNQFFLKEKLINALSASVMQGPTGPTGPQGPATIDVNPDVEELTPGTSPYVTNEGDPNDVMLKFGIPRGVTGATGPVGTIMGTYDTLDELIEAHRTGQQGDAYLVGGSLYVWNVDTQAWESVGDLQGPQGTGTLIKGSYTSLADLQQAHPDGPEEDAYLVNGELFLWNEMDGWHSAGSLQGVGTLIKGSAASKDELDTLHLDGPVEDGYLVGGELYVWDPVAGWHPVGDLQGPPGTPLEQGDPLFQIAAGTETEAIGYDGSLSITSQTLNLSVTTGPAIQIENPAARAGAIIPFASGSAFTVDTDGLTGRRNTAVILGFGSGVTIDLPTDLATSFTLPINLSANSHFAFPVPVAGKVTAVTLSCAAFAPSGITGATNVITARLYYSDTPDTVFKPLTDATASVEIVNGVSGTTFLSSTRNDLSISIAAGTRLLFVIDTHTDPDYTAVTSISALWGGSIKIE